MNLRGLRLKIKDMLWLKNRMIREFLAEFLGTFILVAIGTGINAQTTFGKGAYGQYLSITLGWGWAVAMGVWISGGVSGGHVNPAITVTVAVLGRIKWLNALIYCLAQYLGAFAGSACVYGIYYDALNKYDGGTRVVIGENATAGIWSSYPQPYLSTLSGFADHVFGATLLMVCFMALLDRFNMAPSPGMAPFGVGGIVTVIGMSYGLNAGSSVNPARDFGARAFTACAGWGVEVFTVCNYWFWVPPVAAHVGGICGAWLYQVLVGIHTEPEESHLKDSNDTKENHDDRF